MYCKYCNTQVNKADKYCPCCGAKVSARTVYQLVKKKRKRDFASLMHFYLLWKFFKYH